MAAGIGVVSQKALYLRAGFSGLTVSSTIVDDTKSHWPYPYPVADLIRTVTMGTVKRVVKIDVKK